MQTQAEFKTGRQFIARLLPGKDLLESLKDFCKEKNIKAAYIPMLIGALESADLAHPDYNEKNPGLSTRDVRKYQGPLEFSAQGTVAEYNGKLDFHLHASVAGQKHQVSGMGHFISGKIIILTEVVIVEVIDVGMIRAKDEQIFSAPLLFFK